MNKHSAAIINALGGASSVVIFGASRGAQYAIYVLRQLNIAIDCVVESSDMQSANLYARDQVDRILGLEVLPLARGFKEYPKSKILITTMDSSSLVSLKTKIEGEGWQDSVWIMPDIIACYLDLFTTRSLNHDAFQKNKLQLFHRASRTTNHNISPSVTVLINENCNLTCEHCSAFVPQNQNPATFTVDSIYQSVKNYCDSFDFVYRACIMGGEPFLHRSLTRILEKLATIKNLLFIDIATNGTVVPGNATLDAVKRAGMCVEVSDYGIASRKMEQLFSACSDRGILTYHQKYAYWGSLGQIKNYHRTDAHLHSHFMHCIQQPGTTNHIIGGVLYRCLTSGMASRLSLYPKAKSDQVNLLDENLDATDLIKNVKDMTFRTHPLEACQHCSNGQFTVQAGIQVSSPT